MPLIIGNIKLKNNVIAAPMAGITDKPFRTICHKLGAGMTISEMMSSNPDMWQTEKSSLRMLHPEDDNVKAVQILGNDPYYMAETAKNLVDCGTQLIDINMSCPAKKVNKKLAGSALLQHPNLINKILDAVVNAVNVPVTLKIRTGLDKNTINCSEIAQLAEQCGISAITIHGRTRACLFNGNADYTPIKKVKQIVSIPVIANGDITDPIKAKFVLDYTGADAIMIGRAAQGNPWIFYQVLKYLSAGDLSFSVKKEDKCHIIMQHIKSIHDFYGNYKGLHIARKHISWYLQKYDNDFQFRRLFNAIDDAGQQLQTLEAYLQKYL